MRKKFGLLYFAVSMALGFEGGFLLMIEPIMGAIIAILGLICFLKGMNLYYGGK